jgi:hypothetical protein
MESDEEFFARRRDEERAAAELATKRSAERVHQKLAETYQAALVRTRVLAEDGEQ